MCLFLLFSYLSNAILGAFTSVYDSGALRVKGTLALPA